MLKPSNQTDILSNYKNLRCDFHSQASTHSFKRGTQNELVLAGGHMDKFYLITSSVSDAAKIPSDFLLKETTSDEVMFYIWLYTSCHIPLRIHTDLSNNSLTLPWPLAEEIGILSYAKHLFSFLPHASEAYYNQKWSIVQQTEHPVSLYSVTMSNLVGSMKQPMTLDLKMGTRFCGKNVSKEKAERSKRYAIERGSDVLGFSFTGLKGFSSSGNLIEVPGGSRSRDVACRTINLNADRLFYDFLSTASSCEASIYIGRYFLGKLNEILGFFRNQCCFVFNGSSLLFLFEAVATASQIKSIGIEKYATIHMIDFSYVTIQSGIKDLGYMTGLQNAIAALERAVGALERGIPLTKPENWNVLYPDQ